MHARPCHAPTDTPCPLQYGKTALEAGEHCDEVKKGEVTAVLRRAVLEDVRRKAQEAGEDADEAVRLAKEEMDEVEEHPAVAAERELLQDMFRDVWLQPSTLLTLLTNLRYSRYSSPRNRTEQIR